MTGARPMVAHSDHVTPSSSVEHCSADKTESSAIATSDYWGSPALMSRVSIRSLIEQRQVTCATTIENVAHVWVQAQTSHRWQMEAHEPTSDHITAISNATGQANPMTVSNPKEQL